MNGINGINLRVGAVIIKDGKLLTVKHRDFPFYYCVGGRLEFDESTEQAVIREVFEELGCELEIERLAIIGESFFFADYDGKDHHEIAFYYLMKNCGDLDIAEGTSTDQEREQLFWLDLNELEQFNLVPPFLKNLKNLKTD
jgi:ADP-ribose pyrophosphatase YjhB (NUDIX family)